MKALNGNGSGSGGVDVADYTLWKNNFGMTAAASLASSQVVPEPAASVMAIGIVRHREILAGRDAHALRGSAAISALSRLSRGRCSLQC
ncbi:MAG: hypothetical protein ACR2NU_12945 [Aeoliella sp.]